LGYLRLGQLSTTLSGGESQRIKIARELSENTGGGCLYILDEPTTGLHIDDVATLVRVLRELVTRGNTVVVVEHNPQVILQADHLIDLGPGGGDDGGQVVASGRPAEIARAAGSHTGAYLKKLMKQLAKGSA
jgi:excinuclease ABC subunit A